VITVVPSRHRKLPSFAPVIAEWMSRKFEAPTEAQRMAWPVIAKGQSTLVFSPTGSGKTLAAFLWAINGLVELGDRGELPHKPYIVYVSPLRALANDVEKNLLRPLEEMREIAAEWGAEFPDVRVAVRTGDTLPKERQRMRRRPPHILITTPESFYLLLTSGFREHLDQVRYVIVDEIHQLCGDKRGAHLSISLERLEELVTTGHEPPQDGDWDPSLLQVSGRWRDIREGLTPSPGAPAPLPAGVAPLPGARASRPPPVRIGLSATQSPVDEIARFLVGLQDDGAERDCTVVDLGVRRDIDLQVITAVPNLAEAKPEEVLESIYERLLELIAEHRTTLIFCNSKYWTERVAAKLNQLSEDRSLGLRIGAHHGSMARQFRLEMEDALKQGELRAIVATSTLELGIDIGHLDLVCQIESPKNVAAGLQRVGRAGHLLGLTSKGRLFPISRDDLVEIAVLARAMLTGDLEPVHIPRNCLDVLAQQLCAMAAIEPGPPEAMLRIVRRAYGFRDLPEDDFRRVLEQLSGSYAGRELFETRSRVHWDHANDRVSSARSALTIAQQNAGTIPEYAEYALQAEDYKKKLGTLDEAFVQRMRPGQRFVFGTRTWEYSRVDRNIVYVRDARGRAPTIPYWFGPDVIPRSFKLGEQVAAFRSVMFRRLFDEPDELRQWLMREYHVDEPGAQQIVEYFLEEAHSLDTWPGREAMVVETSRNPLGHLQHLVHSPYGGRLNEAWAEALVQAAHDELALELQVSYSDDALVIHLPPEAETSADEVLRLVTADNLAHWVNQYVATSAMFAIRFRHAAVRALAVLRMSQGKKRAVWQQDAAARRLEREVGPLDRFPLMAETARECVEDYLDLTGLRQVLGEMASGQMRIVHADVEVPSPFGHGLLLAGQFGAVTEIERRERRSELLALHREVLKQILDEDSIRDLLDPSVVADFEARRQGTHENTRARDPDELLALIRRCGELSEGSESPLAIASRCTGGWRAWLRVLWSAGRALPIAFPQTPGRATRWIAAEDFWLYAVAFGSQLKEDHRLTRLLDALRSAAQATTSEIAELLGEDASPLLRKLQDAFRIVQCGEEEGEPLWAVPEQWLSGVLRQTTSRIGARREVLLRVLRGWGPVPVADLCARYGLTDRTLLGVLREYLDTGEVQLGHFVNGRPAPQLCTRANLEELHRLALAALRKTVEPVPLDRYADYLLKWQHVHPRTRLEGSDAIPTLLHQLAGCRAYPRLWERDLLGQRMKSGEPREVGVSVFSREALVGQFSLGEERPRPLLRGLTFIPSNRARELLEAPTTEGLPPDHLTVLRRLRDAGEQPLTDLQTSLGLGGETLERVLWGLYRSGLAANTDYSAVARCGWTNPPRWERDVLGPLHAPEDEPEDTSERTPDADEADLEAAADLRQAGLRSEVGQWFATSAVADLDPSDAAVGRRCRARVMALMQRYGVAARELLLAKSDLSPKDVSRGLRELFMRGQLLRGYFIESLSGDQFALPEGLERLRTEKPADSEPALMVSSLDPVAMHLSVVKLEQLQNRPLATRYLVLRRGRLVAIVDTSPNEERFLRVRDVRVTYTEADEPLQSVLHKQIALAIVEYAVRWGQWEAIRVSQLGGQSVERETPLRSDFEAAGYSFRHGLLRYRLRKRVGAAREEPTQRIVRPTETKRDDIHPTSKPVLDFYNYVLTRYTPPPNKDMLVFLQCSVSRPYSKSPSHASMRKGIRLAVGKDPRADSEECRCHVVVMSSVIGPVPYEMEDVYPADERGGGVKHMSPEEYAFAKPILAERMAAYLRRWHDRYKVITTFTHDRYGAVMEAAKKIAGLDFPILPDARGPRLQGGGTYWGKFWLQIFLELLKGMTDDEQAAAWDRLRKDGAEIDERSWAQHAAPLLGNSPRHPL